jgi:hypothetical protein
LYIHIYIERERERERERQAEIMIAAGRLGKCKKYCVETEREK